MLPDHAIAARVREGEVGMQPAGGRLSLERLFVLIGDALPMKEIGDHQLGFATNHVPGLGPMDQVFRVGRLAAALATPGHDEFRPIVEEFVNETGADLVDVAAALAQLAQGEGSLVLKRKSGGASEFESAPPPAEPSHGHGHGHAPHPRSHAAGVDLDPRKRRKPGFDEPQATYRLDVGRAHGVLPGHVVGAIAHEADLDGKQINGVDIREEHTFVRLPADLSPKIIAKLRRIKLRGRPLEITKLAASELPTPPRRRY